MFRLDIHADDYALTPHTSQDMLACIKAGKLDSISIVPNMSCFRECMELLKEAIPTLPFLPVMSVHLDFVEGKCLAGAKEVPLLAKEENGLIGLSWGSLWILSYFPGKRAKAKRQLKKEIKAQIAVVQKEIDACMETAKQNQIPCAQKGLRIDSHQHAHMIPIVWEALLEVIEEEKYEVEYIRNSKEMFGAFVSETSLWKTYRPINFVKNRLLAIYSHRADRYAKEHQMESMYLWGLIMSGHMDYARIDKLFGKVAKKAKKDGRVLEILFHPGITLPEEVTEELGKDAAEDFYLLPDRHIEKEAVLTLAFDEYLEETL